MTTANTHCNSKKNRLKTNKSSNKIAIYSDKIHKKQKGLLCKARY